MFNFYPKSVKNKYFYKIFKIFQNLKVKTPSILKKVEFKRNLERDNKVKELTLLTLLIYGSSTPFSKNKNKIYVE